MTALDPDRPGWVWAADELRVWARTAAELLAGTIVDGGTDPVLRRPPADLLKRWATESWSDVGAEPDQVWAELREMCAYPFGNAHPRFSAWVNSPPHPLAAMAAGVAAALNPSVAGGDHAAVHVEHQVVRWFTELLGWPSTSGGQTVSGASAAALTALTVARQRALARHGVDVRRHGMSALGAKIAVYGTAEAHSCHVKALEALGIGSDNLIRVPADVDRRMSASALDQRLTEDRTAGVIPIAVLASAGTVNTGAIDPLGDIAEVCSRHGTWLHVDAAYGGPAALLLDDLGWCRAGLARADSIAIDPHKWLYVPVDAGLVLFAERGAAREAFSLVPDYLRTGGNQREPVWFSEYGLEQTRPMRALKVWVTLKHLGRERMRRLIARDIAVAESLKHAVTAAPDFELLGHGLSVVCWRHRPVGLGGDGLDQHNEDTLRRVVERGQAFVAGTRVDGVFAMRACIVNPATTTAHTRALLGEIRTAAAPS